MPASTANIGSDRNDAPQIFQDVTVNGTFKTNGPTISTGATTQTGNETIVGDITATSGNVIAGTAGKGLQVKEGTNARMGVLTLNGATPVVVSNTSVTANTRIFLTANASGGTPAHFWVSARSAGASFSVTGTAGDTSVVAWLLIEPAP